MSHINNAEGPGPSVAAHGQSPVGYEDIRVWDRRVEAMARKAKLGIAVDWIQEGWSERYPDDQFEDAKPCKKVREAITRYAPSVLLFKDQVFAPFCIRPPTESSLLEEYRLVAREVAALGQERRAQVVGNFERWTKQVGAVWCSSYARLAEEPPLFSCELDIFAASQGPAELDGLWAYLDDDKVPCSFSIEKNEEADSKSRHPYIFREDLPSGLLSGLLVQTTEGSCNWTAALRQRTGIASTAPYGVIELQMTKPDLLKVRFVPLGGFRPEDTICSTAVRSRHYRIRGYGEGPKMAAVQAMQRAKQEIPCP